MESTLTEWKSFTNIVFYTLLLCILVFIGMSYTDIYITRLEYSYEIARVFCFLIGITALFTSVAYNHSRKKFHELIIGRRSKDNFLAEALKISNGTKSNTYGLNEYSYNGITLFHAAVIVNANDLCKNLIKKGADFSLNTEGGLSTLELCVFSGNVEVFNLLKDKVDKSDRIKNIPKPYMDAFLGNDIPKDTDPSMSWDGNIFNWRLVEFIANGKENINNWKTLYKTDPKGKFYKSSECSFNKVGSFSMSAVKKPAIIMAIESGNQSLAIEMYKDFKMWELSDENKKTILMYAAEAGNLEVVKIWRFEMHPIDEVDTLGFNAKSYASASNLNEILEELEKPDDVYASGKIANSLDAIPSESELGNKIEGMSYKEEKEFQNSDIVTNVVEVFNPLLEDEEEVSENVAPINSEKIELKKVKRSIKKSLLDMVSTESFVDSFAALVYDFLNNEYKQSKGIVLWGETAVGKTEISKRLSGLISKYPGLELEGLDTKYIACCDGQLNISKELESIENNTIVFLDEIDKFFDPEAGLVDSSQAKGYQSSLITHFSAKPIIWVFLGTFKSLRGDDPLTEKLLSKCLGNELASRLEFIDWRLEDWNYESLLKASQFYLNSSNKNITFDDDALVLILERALESGGGVRSFEKYVDQLKRKSMGIDETINISREEVISFLERLG